MAKTELLILATCKWIDEGRHIALSSHRKAENQDREVLIPPVFLLLIDISVL